MIETFVDDPLGSILVIVAVVRGSERRGRAGGTPYLRRQVLPRPRTDVHLLAVGAAADRFAVHMDLDGPEPDDDEPITPEEEAEWQAYVQEALGPYWRPGTAIVTLRTSAPDGLVEAIARSARGTVPA